MDEGYGNWLKDLRRKQKLSVVYDMPDLSEPGRAVSEAEATFFRDRGFIVKKGLLDPVKLTSAFDNIWSHQLAKMPTIAEAGWQLSREDRETWVNPRWLSMEPHPTSGPFQNAPSYRGLYGGPEVPIGGAGWLERKENLISK